MRLLTVLITHRSKKQKKKKKVKEDKAVFKNMEIMDSGIIWPILRNALEVASVDTLSIVHR